MIGTLPTSSEHNNVTMQKAENLGESQRDKQGCWQIKNCLHKLVQRQTCITISLHIWHLHASIISPPLETKLGLDMLRTAYIKTTLSINEGGFLPTCPPFKQGISFSCLSSSSPPVQSRRRSPAPETARSTTIVLLRLLGLRRIIILPQVDFLSESRDCNQRHSCHPRPLVQSCHGLQLTFWPWIHESDPVLPCFNQLLVVFIKHLTE